MIHLDTNLLIALLDSSHLHAALVESLLSTGEPLGCSSLAWMEIHSKPISLSSSDLLREVLRGGITPFTSQEAEIAGQWFQNTGGKRQLRFDCCIAAAAMTQGAKLATANKKDFELFLTWGLELQS